MFRQLVKFYESKQYKKAIKAADAILKKFPEHGETLAMKVSGLPVPCPAAQRMSHCPTALRVGLLASQTPAGSGKAVSIGVQLLLLLFPWLLMGHTRRVTSSVGCCAGLARCCRRA